jgi:sulfite reductase (ferredoxin)
VLAIEPPAENNTRPGGELLRAWEAEDDRAFANAGKVGSGLFAAARDALDNDRPANDPSTHSNSTHDDSAHSYSAHSYSAHSYPARDQRASDQSVRVIDVDVSLGLRTAVIQFAGRGTAALGPLGVRLADRFGVARIQWLSIADSSPSILSDGDCETASQPRGEKTIAAAGQSPLPADLPTAAQLRSILRGDQGERWESQARRYRAPIGLAGLYLQKMRQGPARRRWMIRLKATGGRLTAGQWRGLVDVADSLAGSTLRLTMRQGLQLHAILPENALPVLEAIDRLALTTAGSCGNSLRNVTCCPWPAASAAARLANQVASQVAHRWLPRAAWLQWQLVDETSEADAESEIESHGDQQRDVAYPRGYLPHKWKIGVATANDNCINVLSNDLGLVVGIDGEKPYVDLYVGGSLAYRPGKLGSFARLAVPLGRIALADLEIVIEALMQLHMTHARDNDADDHRPGAATRTARHHQRLKYLVQRLGTEGIAEWLENHLRRDRLFQLAAHRLPPVADGEMHRQFESGGAGRMHVAIEVAGGRIDCAGARRDAWSQLFGLGEAIRIGPQHTLILEAVSPRDRGKLEALLAGPLATAAWIANPKSDVLIRRTVACVALPTCPMAVDEAERHQRKWTEASNQVAGLIRQICGHRDDQPLSVAVSGCSNGCSQPLTVDLGVVAEAKGRFRVFVAGTGRRLGHSVGIIDGPEQLPRLVRQFAAENVNKPENVHPGVPRPATAPPRDAQQPPDS